MVGNKFFVAILFSLVCSAVNLEVTDLTGNNVDVVELRRPFLATIILEPESKVNNCRLKHEESIKILDSTSLVSQVVGTNEKQYKIVYKLQANETGKLTVGPAMLQSNDGDQETNNVEVDVKIGLPHFELYLPRKSTIVEGEQFSVKAKFYFDDNGAKPKLQVGDSLGDGLKLIKVDTLGTGREIFNGSEVCFIEWNLLVKANKVGSVKINPQSVLFTRQESESSASVFIQRSYTDRITSNSLYLRVYPLPDSELDAIGVFKNFKSKLNSSEAKLNDAVVLTLQVEGEVDLEDLSYSSLQLPKGLTFYESKSSISGSKKNFEFIVQGSKEGNYKIPEQTFTYFDTNKRSCSVLKSNPLELEVTQKTPLIGSENKEGIKVERQDLIPVLQEFRTYEVSSTAMPFAYFLALLLLPLIYMLFRAVPKRAKSKPSSQSAKSRILKAKQASELILILNEAGVTKKRLVECLQLEGVGKSKTEKYLGFYVELESARYFSGTGNLEDLKNKAEELLECVE